MRRVVVIVVGVLIFGCAGSDRRNNGSSGGGSSGVAPAPAPKQAFGEWGALGGFSYKLDAWYGQQNVGTGYARKTASDGAIYVVIDYQIRNDGNETATIYNSDLKLRDDVTGRTFTPDSQAETAIMMSGGEKGFILDQVQPGLAKKQYAAFLIPDSSFNTSLTLVVPSKGWDGATLEYPLDPKARK